MSSSTRNPDNWKRLIVGIVITTVIPFVALVIGATADALSIFQFFNNQVPTTVAVFTPLPTSLPSPTLQPNLQYWYCVETITPDPQVKSQYREQLIEEFFLRVYEYKLPRSDTKYLDAAKAVTPPSSFIATTEPISIVVYISNIGGDLATGAEFHIEIDRTITNMSKRPTNVGYSNWPGQRDFAATISNTRASETIIIVIASDYAASESQKDKIVLENREDDSKLILEPTLYPAANKVRILKSSLTFLGGVTGNGKNVTGEKPCK